MSLIRNPKNAFLFTLGVVIALSSAAYFYVEQSGAVLAIIFLVIGFCFLLFGLFGAFKLNHKTARVSDLAFDWSKAGAFIVVVLCSVFFLFGVHYFAQKISHRWDVTKYDQHTLNQTTIDFVKGIEAPVELTAFYVGLPPKYLQDLLNQYAHISDHKISVNVVDPINDIAQAAKYGNVISGEERKLIVVSGDARRDVDFSNKSLTEEQITNALVRIIRKPRQAYFLTGHGELSESDTSNLGLSQFAELLNANNIHTKNLMLGTLGKIPDDCDVLIVAGPRSHLTDAEEALIQDYLLRGGDALFLVEAITLTSPGSELAADQIDKNPSLNAILNQWGVDVGDDVVVDVSSHIGGDQGSPATKNYGKHEAITTGLDYTFYIRPRSIAVLKNRRNTLKLAPIARTASKEKSWAETDRALNVRFDQGVDVAGPVALSYIIWEGKEIAEESDTRIIVFTDADFLSNAYLNQYSNSAMGINVVNWLVESDYVVFNDQKEIKVERLDLTSKQKRMIAVLLVLMPLLIALVGIFVWVRF